MSATGSRPHVDEVTIRKSRPEDAAACGRICYVAFGTINAAHWFSHEMPSEEAAVGLLTKAFSHPGFWCVVAEQDGRIVGSNCMDERSVVFGIGPITVDPKVQNHCVGRRLMEAVLDRSRKRHAPAVRLLQAAFHNRSLSLYTKLGFDPREPMSVMQGQPLGFSIDGCAVRPAIMSDLDAANRVCQLVHGHSRSGELSDAITHGTALVVEREGRITGYVTGFGYFAHGAGECNLDLQALIAAADSFGGPGMIVPTRNAALFRWCLEKGLRVIQPLTLMTMGMYNEPQGAYLPSILY